MALGGVGDDALVEGGGDGAGLRGSGEHVVDGLVHAEVVEEGAAVDAERAVGRQEAGEVVECLVLGARVHQLG